MGQNHTENLYKACYSAGDQAKNVDPVLMEPVIEGQADGPTDYYRSGQ